MVEFRNQIGLFAAGRLVQNCIVSEDCTVLISIVLGYMGI
jgi:hypothetical protein